MKRFMTCFLIMILTLAGTISPAASFLPDGSSLTIESDEGISPLAISIPQVAVGIRSSDSSYATYTFFNNQASLSTFPPTFSSLTNFSGSPRYLTPQFVSASNSSSYSGFLVLQVSSNIAYTTYLSYNNESGTILNSLLDFPSVFLEDMSGESSDIMQTFFIPFLSRASVGQILPAIPCYGLNRVTLGIYADGVYPDYSFLYSLAPANKLAKPVYFNSVQAFYGSYSHGSFNGGLLGDTYSIRILNDYVPPAGASYNFSVYQVYTSTQSPFISLAGSPNLCTASVVDSRVLSEIYGKVLNATIQYVTYSLTFDGKTSISDLIIQFDSASTSLFGGTLVHASYADYNLYNPSGDVLQNNILALQSAIESLDFNNTDALEQAQNIIDSNQRALALQLEDQHNESMSQAAEQHSEAMSQESSLADEIMNGYDVGSQESSAYESLDQHVEEWFSQEELIQSQVESLSSQTEGVFETLDFLELSDGFNLVGGWMQRLFEKSGNFQGVFSLSITMVLLSLLFGATKVFTHRKGDDA